MRMSEEERDSILKRIRVLEEARLEHVVQLRCGVRGHIWTVQSLNCISPCSGIETATFRCMECNLSYWRKLDALTKHESELVRVTEGKEAKA